MIRITKLELISITRYELRSIKRELFLLQNRTVLEKNTNAPLNIKQENTKTLLFNLKIIKISINMKLKK